MTTLIKILIIFGMFILGLILSQIFGWWLLYFLGIAAEIAVENVE